MPAARQPDAALRDRAERHVFERLPGLDARERRALALVDVAGLPLPEAGRELGLAGEDLATLLWRARKALRRHEQPLPAGARCERAERLLSVREADPLPRDDRRWLDVHLRRCPRCERHRVLLDGALTRLRATFTAETTPIALPEPAAPAALERPASGEPGRLRLVPPAAPETPPAIEAAPEPRSVEAAPEPPSVEAAPDATAIAAGGDSPSPNEAPEEPAAALGLPGGPAAVGSPAEPTAVEPPDEPAAIEPPEELARIEPPQEPAALEPPEEPAALEPPEEPAGLEPAALAAAGPPVAAASPPVAAADAPAPGAAPPVPDLPARPAQAAGRPAAPRVVASPRRAHPALRAAALVALLVAILGGIGAGISALGDDGPPPVAPWARPGAPEVHPAPLSRQ